MNYKITVVKNFWDVVWNEKQIDRIDDFMTEDFVIHSAGKDITPRSEFYLWVQNFQKNIDDLHFNILDIFSSDDLVTTRWMITGKNRGFMGAPDNGKEIHLSGITISKVNDKNLIYEKWVERSAHELYQYLMDSML